MVTKGCLTPFLTLNWDDSLYLLVLPHYVHTSSDQLLLVAFPSHHSLLEPPTACPCANTVIGILQHQQMLPMLPSQLTFSCWPSQPPFRLLASVRRLSPHNLHTALNLIVQPLPHASISPLTYVSLTNLAYVAHPHHSR